MSIIIFIIILAILIFVHELGHFLVAKKSGIRVDEFGLGFPPKILSKKWGETLYTLNAIPFGGFVKIFGEDQHAEEISEESKSVSFVYKPKWIQASVLVAGVTFNVLFAWLLITFGFVLGLPSPVDHGGLGEVTDLRLTITEVLDGSPAKNAGFLSGDVVYGISSETKKFEGFDITVENVTETISDPNTKAVEVKYIRGNNEGVVTVLPEINAEGKKMIGIAMENIGVLKLPVHLAILEGARVTISLIKNTVVGLSGFFWDALRLRSDFSQVSGPIGIAKVVGEASTLGFVYLLTLTSLISINLAVINLLPFPALDGGRLLFVFIEAVLRRPISPKFVNLANTLGFAFLIMLMIAVTTHDIWKLF
ncbi:MAG: M50 family metallopeptidase [Minisyncoccia bacterium]